VVNVSSETARQQPPSAGGTASGAALAGEQRRLGRIRRRRGRARLALSVVSLIGAVALWQAIVELMDIQERTASLPCASW
jgi:hypothetical protein